MSDIHVTVRFARHFLRVRHFLPFNKSIPVADRSKDVNFERKHNHIQKSCFEVLCFCL